MDNIIRVSKCDNELTFVAYQWGKSYDLLKIQSGNSHVVDVTITIVEGDYVAQAPINGVDVDLRKSVMVTLPKGQYSLLATGINWGGEVEFAFTLNGVTYNKEHLFNQPSGLSFFTQPISLLVDSLSVGNKYQGGIVGYIFQPGDAGYVAGQTHGLIVSETDLFSGNVIRWYNSNNVVTGATDTAIGTGKSNTQKIMNVQGRATLDATYAAQLCVDYVSPDGTYHDWFLPSVEELVKLRENKLLIAGGFKETSYWSSSEESATNAKTCLFNNNANFIASDGKFNGWLVRAVRYF